MTLGEFIHIACWFVLVYTPMTFAASYLLHEVAGLPAPWEKR